MDALLTRDIIPNLRTLVFRDFRRLDEAVVSLLKIYANRRPILRCLWLDRYNYDLCSRVTVQALESGGLEVGTFTEEF